MNIYNWAKGVPLTLIIALALFSLLAFYQLSLPGLHYDEAQEVIPALQLIRGLPTQSLHGASVHLAGRDFPLMIQNYIGAINSYLVLPIFLLGGITVTTLRLLGIILGSVTIILAYILSTHLFDRRTADLTALLVAVNPSFVFFTRQGTFVTSILTVLTTSSMLCLLLWWKSRRPMYLYLVFFLLGLGLWAKLSFLWFLGALVLVAILFSAPRLWQEQSLPINISRRQLATAILFLVLGMSPLLLFNLQTQATIQEIARFLATSYYGISNLSLFQNLEARLGNFNSLLDGGHFWYLGTIAKNHFYPPLFLLIAISAMFLMILRDEKRGQFIFLLLTLLFMIPLSIFTISDFKPTHYILLLPLPQMTIAAGLIIWARRHRLLLAIALISAASLFGLDLRSDIEYHQALARTGGFPDHSAAIYDLAAYLEDKADRPIVAMDWGLRNSVYFLSQGKVAADEIFGYESFTEPDPGLADRLRLYLDNPQTLYLFHTPEWTIFHRRQTFQALVAQAGMRVKVVETFYDWSGMPVYIILRVEE